LRLTHFYPWHGMPDEFIGAALSLFAEHGARYLTFTDQQCPLMLSQPDYEKQISARAAEYGLSFSDAHGLCFRLYDLNTDDAELRARSIRDHIQVIERLAAIGVKTYTVHIGAALHQFPPMLELPVLRENALRTLEGILPTAEKNDMVIALENSFEPPNAPDELLWYLQQFSSKHLLLCFDSGHENYMSRQGKDLSRFSEYHVHTAWKGDLRLEDDALGKMAPYIVTAHLHDNSGYNDDHFLPGKGTINWSKIMGRLKKCPRLQSLQNESSVIRDKLSIAEMCESFDQIMQY